MRRNKKQNRTMFLLVLLLMITLGYALVSATLKIRSVANLNKNTFYIHWENINVTEGSATATTPANIVNPTTVEFEVMLNKPGDYYEFTVDAKNDGIVDGILKVISIDAYDPTGETKINDEDLPPFVSKTFGLADGSEIGENHILKVGRKEKFKIRIDYTNDVSEEDVNKDYNCMFKVTVKYVQDKLNNSGATFVANTDSNVKGLIGTAYYDPTNPATVCTNESQTPRIPLYAATSNPEIDNKYDLIESTSIYRMATSYAVPNYSSPANNYNGGCMKWYVYKDTGNSYKMILDHNTTAYSYAYGGDRNLEIPTSENLKVECQRKYHTTKEIHDCLYVLDDVIERDTVDWVDDVDIISAEELAEIIGAENFDSSVNSIISLPDGYSWLLDNTEVDTTSLDRQPCTEPTCFVQGYWTNNTNHTIIDKESDYNTYISWYIDNSGLNYTTNSWGLYAKHEHNRIGIRPVITVSKSLFKSQ